MKFSSAIVLLLIGLLIVSCKTNRVVKNERVGKWIFKDTFGGKHYTTKGNYRKGLETGTWKQFSGNKLVKKQLYNKQICFTTFYNENGTVMARGKSRMIITDKLVHWFYYDDWKYYDGEGNLESIRTYENGEEVNELIIK